MSQILDSGNRREFETGAVRDIAEGKGRMDLLPLREIALFIDFCKNPAYPVSDEITISEVFSNMNTFLQTGGTDNIRVILKSFIQTNYKSENLDDSIRNAILDLSIHYEQGAAKYEERNWEKGINCHCYVDSALRHFVKWDRGDTDEPHDRAFMWNLFGLLWTIKNKPEMNVLPYNKTDSRPFVYYKKRPRDFSI